MDIVKKIVSNIIDKSELFREKSKQNLRRRIGKLSKKEIPEALSLQKNIETEIRDRLRELNTNKIFRQFLNPALQSEYEFDTNPLSVLYHYAFEELVEKTKTKKTSLAIRLIERDKQKIINAIERGMNKLRELEGLCRKAPLPQFPLKRISYVRIEYNDILSFIKNNF